MTTPTVSEKKKSLIGSLISGKSPFTVSSSKVLEEMDESTLEELDKKYKEEEAKKEEAATTPESTTTLPNPPASDASTSSDTVQVSEQELQDLRQVAAQFKAQQEAIKDNLVKSLLSNPSVSSVFNEKALKEKSVSDLSDLAKVCKISAPATTDFSVIPFTETSSVNAKKDDIAPGPTVSLSERLKQKRAKSG